MQPAHFDTRAFFTDILAPAGSGFTQDLERFAQRAEAAEKGQGGLLVLEALVIFGEAGRRIDESGWTALSTQAAASVRKGEEERAARLLVPQGALTITDTLSVTAESARLVNENMAIDSEAVAHSRCAAIVAALFRALSRHFAETAGGGDVESEAASDAAG